MTLGLHYSIESLYKFADSPVKRVGTGIKEVDALISGPAPGEVCMILGRSYSGKSIVAANIIHHNMTLPSIFFSMEMPANMALLRMYSVWSDTPHSDIQHALETGKLPEDLWDLAIAYPKHILIDEAGLSLDDMSDIVEESEKINKERPAFIVIDYLELLGGAKASGEGLTAVDSQATNLKDWAKREQMRVFVLHQTNAQEPEWKPPTARSARYSGYTEADFVVGMWRPHKNPELHDWERQGMYDLVNFNILKNRPFGLESMKIEKRLAPSLRIEDRVFASPPPPPYNERRFG